MGTEEMRQAMNTLRHNQKKNKTTSLIKHVKITYVSRIRCDQTDSERKIEQERAEKEAAIQREQKALAEIERLKKLL